MVIKNKSLSNAAKAFFLASSLALANTSYSQTIAPTTPLRNIPETPAYAPKEREEEQEKSDFPRSLMNTAYSRPLSYELEDRPRGEMEKLILRTTYRFQEVLENKADNSLSFNLINTQEALNEATFGYLTDSLEDSIKLSEVYTDAQHWVSRPLGFIAEKSALGFGYLGYPILRMFYTEDRTKEKIEDFSVSVWDGVHSSFGLDIGSDPLDPFLAKGVNPYNVTFMPGGLELDLGRTGDERLIKTHMGFRGVGMNIQKKLTADLKVFTGTKISLGFNDKLNYGPKNWEAYAGLGGRILKNSHLALKLTRENGIGNEPSGFGAYIVFGNRNH